MLPSPVATQCVVIGLPFMYLRSSNPTQLFYVSVFAKL